jgi:hypothetical protein
MGESNVARTVLVAGRALDETGGASMQDNRLAKAP